METKQCSKCKEVKQVTEFHKQKGGKYGVRADCKKCSRTLTNGNYEKNKDKIKERMKTYYLKNKDKIKEREKVYRIKNKEKLNEISRNYYTNNKEKIKERVRKYKENNKEKVKERRKVYYLNNKDKIKENRKNYYEINKDKIKEKAKKYNYENTEKIKERHKKYVRSRLKTDDLFKLKNNLRVLIRNSFVNNGFSKKSQTYKILGCSFEEFKIHLERQFLKGMTWENRDKWHIDHIVPIATAKTEEEVIRLNHYTNLRPLWAEENLSKSDKIVTHQLVLL